MAFDTAGHCYITESGKEEDNNFINNLSVYNKHRFGTIGQSDDIQARQQTSSFWIRNMKNNFIGNAAAGGNIGFWIEMKDKHGNQDEYEFRSNSAHSFHQGLNFYAKGWKPYTYGLIDNFTSYKNEEGIKCHICGNFKVSNSLLAENKYGMRHGVGNTGVDIENSTFLGYTDDSEARKGMTGPNGLGVRASYNTGFYNDDAALSFTNVVSFWSTHLRPQITYHDELLESIKLTLILYVCAYTDILQIQQRSGPSHH